MAGGHIAVNTDSLTVTGVTVRSIYSVLRVFRASRNTVVFLAQWGVARAQPYIVTLTQLTAILSGSAGDRRIRSIQKLEFHYLSNLESFLTPIQNNELREQQQLANETFSKRIKVLFSHLKGWEERLNASGTVGAGLHQMHLLPGKEFRQKEALLPTPPSLTKDILVLPLLV